MKDLSKINQGLIEENILLKQRIQELEEYASGHKPTEELWLENKGRLREIIVQNPISMAIVSMEGIIEYINRKAVETFGYEPVDIPDMAHWWELAYPQETYRKEVIEQWMGLVEKAIVSHGEIEKRDYRITCKDGTIKTVVVFGILTAGKVFVMFEDITERKQAEDAVRESRDQIRLIANNVPALISYIDSDFRYRFANEFYAKLENISTTEIVGKHMKEIMGEEYYIAQSKNMQTALSGREVLFEADHFTKKGKKLKLSVTYIPDMDSQGQAQGFYAFAADITERKRAEEALAESKAFLTSVVDSTSDLIWSFDPLSFRLISFNRAYSEHFLKTRGLHVKIGLLPEDLLPADYAKLWREWYQRVLDEGPYSMEYITHDGSLTLELSFNILKQNDAVFGVSVFGKDITERKRAADSLKIFKESVDNSSDAIGLSTPEGRHFYQNRAFGQLFGIIGDASPKTIYVDNQIGEEVFRTIMTGGQWTGEVNMYAKDRQFRNILLHAYPNKDEQGNITALVGIHTDITERKRAEEERRDKDLRYRSLFDKATDGIFLIDLDGRILDVNESFAEMHGYTVDELFDKDLFDLDTPETAKLIPERMKRIVEGEALNFEVEHYHKDGHVFQLNVVANKIELNGKKYILCFHRDMTLHKQAEAERRRLEERLQRAEKMEALGQLAGGVAHDLNNVLGILTGYSELLLMEIPEGSRSRGHVEKILQSTEKGAAIIQDLLTLARRGVTVSDVVNLNSIISGFLKAPVFEGIKVYHPRITFKTECDTNLLNIKGSPVHLEKTLLNLVSNAAEAIAGEGEVTIRTENRYLDKPLRGYDEIKQGDYVVLTVCDTGMGIPTENREKIFEPFYTKKAMGRSGTGLGLAIVWGTVKDHEGYIDVQTEVGEGTTFTLFFPITREELIVPKRKEIMEQYMGKGESVLVVDDIAEQRDVASSLLTQLGYDIHTVASGEEAVEYLKKHKADILVIDMIMAPGIDGLETYQKVLKVNPNQKAVLVSGFSETDRVKEALKLGAGAYVKKPYVLERIGVAIRDELARK